jgi:hypothetical protein
LGNTIDGNIFNKHNDQEKKTLVKRIFFTCIEFIQFKLICFNLILLILTLKRIPSVFMYAMNIQNDVIGLVLHENCKSKQVTDFIAWPSRCHVTMLIVIFFSVMLQRNTFSIYCYILQFSCFIVIMKRMFKQWWSSIPTIWTIRTNTSHLHSLNTKKETMAHEDGNPGPGLRQTQTCGRLNGLIGSEPCTFDLI